MLITNRSNARASTRCSTSISIRHFNTQILGVIATVERIDMTDDEQIVAICRRGRSRQVIPILDLPLPNPRPAGAEWIEAYRHWAAGE
jgi:hypothetical protein